MASTFAPTNLPTFMPTNKPTAWPTNSPNEYESVHNCSEASLWRAAFGLALACMLLVGIICIGAIRPWETMYTKLGPKPTTEQMREIRRRRHERDGIFALITVSVLIVYVASQLLALIPRQHPGCTSGWAVNLGAGTDASNCAVGTVAIGASAMVLFVVGAIAYFSCKTTV